MSGSPREVSPIRPDPTRGSGLGHVSISKCAGRGLASPCRPHPVAGSAPGPATIQLGGRASESRGYSLVTPDWMTSGDDLPRPLLPTNRCPGRMSAGKVSPPAYIQPVTPARATPFTDCPRCRRPIVKQDIYCPWCGYDLERR